MHRILITFAPDSPEIMNLVDEIRAAFDPGLFETTSKPARESTIVDIALADVVLFGLQKPGASDLPSDYDELLRVFKGANLAGKACSLFSLGTEKPAGGLRKALLETDISLLDDEPAFGVDQDGRRPEIEQWAHKVATLARDTRDAGR